MSLFSCKACEARDVAHERERTAYEARITWLERQNELLQRRLMELVQPGSAARAERRPLTPAAVVEKREAEKPPEPPPVFPGGEPTTELDWEKAQRFFQVTEGDPMEKQ